MGIFILNFLRKGEYLFLIEAKAYMNHHFSVGGAQLLSCVRFFLIPWIVACQAPLLMEFSRQRHWSGVPFPPPGGLPKAGTETTSPVLAGRFFTTEPPGNSNPS